MIRRAIFLRAVFSKNYPSLFADRLLGIANNVLHALLKIERLQARVTVA